MNTLDSQKNCSKCTIVKPLSEFNFRNTKKGIRHSYCRDCGKILTRNHYKNNKKQYLERNLRAFRKRREFVRQVKSKPCFDCGIQYPYYVMDFDHREGEVKEYAMSQIDQMTMEDIKCEMKKCDVVCSNCHRERTFQRIINKKIKFSGE